MFPKLLCITVFIFSVTLVDRIIIVFILTYFVWRILKYVRLDSDDVPHFEHLSIYRIIYLIPIHYYKGQFLMPSLKIIFLS